MAERGTHVTIVEMADELAAAGNLLYKAALTLRLRELSDRIDVMTNTSCLEILPEGVRVQAKSTARAQEGAVSAEPAQMEQTEKEVILPADRVVYCVGMRARRELAESFYGITYDVQMIGDCMGARRINEASHEGFFAGHRI